MRTLSQNFPGKGKRTSENNVRMGSAVAPNSEIGRGFLATVFWIHWQGKYTKAEITKIQQRDFVLVIDREKEVGYIVKEIYERIYQNPRHRKQTELNILQT